MSESSWDLQATAYQKRVYLLTKCSASIVMCENDKTKQEINSKMTPAKIQGAAVALFWRGNYYTSFLVLILRPHKKQLHAISLFIILILAHFRPNNSGCTLMLNCNSFPLRNSLTQRSFLSIPIQCVSAIHALSPPRSFGSLKGSLSSLLISCP